MTPRTTRFRAAAIGLALSPSLALAQGGLVPSVAAKPSTKAAGATTPAASVTVIAGEQYRAGAVQRWFLGDVYRDLWTTAMRVPVLDLGTFAGGLKPLKAGGGMQTKSLRLVSKDGNEYVFRVVLKDHAWTVPPKFKGSLIEKMSRDQGSTGHPAAAMVAAPLLEAVGVLHATPILVVMPRDAPLGEFSEEFSGQLGIIEQYPHKPEKGEGFAGASQIIDSEELLKKLNEDPTQHVDAKAFLTARVMDMFLGDWDRHPGQWKWARMESGKHGEWVAIARDRDMAFVTYEGVVAKIGHVFTPVSARFSGTSANVAALTNNSLELDRRLLSGLEKPAWDSVTADVMRRITDAVIDEAVAALPAEYVASAPRLAAALKERRTRMPRITNGFYALVFDVADLHATDQADRATITRVSDGFVDVRVESGKDVLVFSRRFDARETREIRLYLHGGDDSAVVLGHVRRSIPVRIIGGNGTNWLADSSTVDGEHGRAHLYDDGTTEGVSYGKDTLFNRRHWEKEYGALEPSGRDRGHAMEPSGGISAERGMGLTPRVRITRYEYGFERRPYASKLELQAEYATNAHGFRIIASADQRLERSAVHFTEVVRASGLELISYYGLGNTTTDSGAGSYYAARQQQLMFHPAIAIALGRESDLSLGPVVTYSSTDSTPGRFISAGRPYGFGRFGEAGVQLGLHHELQDRAIDPDHRFVLDVNGGFFPAVWDVKSAFETLSLGVEGSVKLHAPLHPTIVYRAGGKKVFGDFPFHEAAFVGGNGTLRYMGAQRYAGDASVWASTEVRIPVTTLSILIPVDMGVGGLAESGRVYLRGDSPGGWHSVVGAGLWFGLRGNHLQVITVMLTTEQQHRGVQLRAGLAF